MEGKAVPTGGAYFASYFFLGLLLTEFVMRRQKALPIPWGDVEAVRLDPAKMTGVIGYHLPGKPNARFSLGFKLPDAATFSQLRNTVREFVPERVEEGPVKGVNTVVVVLIVFAILMALITVASLPSPGKH